MASTFNHCITLVAGLMLGMPAAAHTRCTEVAANAASCEQAFAALPDRARLLAYDGPVDTRFADSVRWHPVELSEAHALNAATPGESIVLPLPDGTQLALAYLRREIGVDGNWTWFGGSGDGHRAVLTFGNRAAFGLISRPDGEAMQLTTRDGRAWLIEPGLAGTAPAESLGVLPDADTRIVPRFAAATIPPERAATTPASAAAKGGGATVDLVLGFTSGLASQLGGVSQANTRLVQLVAVTNQALLDSLVTSSLRLVGTLQLNYGDSSNNTDTLEALTGYSCSPSCAPQPVPSLLQPLVAAREQYGADLVALVRPYRVPQQGACGSAWLIGGGGFTIDAADAPFGYAVVSDGSDVDEGTGLSYFCPVTTLARYLGHNMGQQRNIEDSNGSSGTHSYAYGYREGTSTGFYTIMANRLANSSQFGIAHYANPAVNYANTGRPTGTATANNGRSLELSMPLVATFREPPVDVVFTSGFEP